MPTLKKGEGVILQAEVKAQCNQWDCTIKRYGSNVQYCNDKKELLPEKLKSELKKST